MKITMISHGVLFSSPPIRFQPAEQYDWKPSSAQPQVDVYGAVEGWVDITPEAAQRARDHYHETGNRLDLHGIEGSGSDGRVLLGDVEGVIEPVGEEVEYEYEDTDGGEEGGGAVISEVITESATFSDEE